MQGNKFMYSIPSQINEEQYIFILTTNKIEPSQIAPIKRKLECQAQNKSSTSVANKSEVKNTGERICLSRYWTWGKSKVVMACQQ